MRGSGWSCSGDVFMSLLPFCPLPLLEFYPEYQGLCPSGDSLPCLHISLDQFQVNSLCVPAEMLPQQLQETHLCRSCLLKWVGLMWEHWHVDMKTAAWGCKGAPGLTHCWSPSSPLICSHPPTDYPSRAMQCWGCWDASWGPYWTKFHL